METEPGKIPDIFAIPPDDEVGNAILRAIDAAPYATGFTLGAIARVVVLNRQRHRPASAVDDTVSSRH